MLHFIHQRRCLLATLLLAVYVCLPLLEWWGCDLLDQPAAQHHALHSAQAVELADAALAELETNAFESKHAQADQHAVHGECHHGHHHPTAALVQTCQFYSVAQAGVAVRAATPALLPRRLTELLRPPQHLG